MRKSDLLASLSMIISIIALFLAIGAYEKAGGNIKADTVTTMKQTQQTAEQDLIEAKKVVEQKVDELDEPDIAEPTLEENKQAAQIALTKVRADIVAKTITDQTYVDIEAARKYVNDAYKENKAEIIKIKNDWNIDLKNLENMIKTESSEVLSFINGLIEKLN